MYQDFGHSHFRNSLMWGEGLENVAITGTGRIWGKGLSRGVGAQNAGRGQQVHQPEELPNVLLRDFSIFHGGHFGILATGVDNLTIDNLKIDTNRDGMDVDCLPQRPHFQLLRELAVGRRHLPEGRLRAGLRQADRVRHHHQLLRERLLGGRHAARWHLQEVRAGARRGHTGRIKFGTESNGGFRNITISNCVFEGCQGLALETVDGALLEDVTITNISMRDIVSAPIFLRLGSRMRGPEACPWER